MRDCWRCAVKMTGAATVACALATTLFIAWTVSSAAGTVSRRTQQRLAAFVPSGNWSARWWLAPGFGGPLMPRATRRCRLCFFRPQPRHGTSGPTDAVVTVALGEIYGLPTTIRSARTAGICAAIVVLADAIAANVIRTAIAEVAGPCGVIVVDFGAIDPASQYTEVTRWRMAFDFLSANPYQFQRFILVDAYDTFFQGDVFDDTVTPEKLLFAQEAILLSQRQMPQVWTDAFSRLLDNRTALTRQIALFPILGGVRPFLKFCRLLFRLDAWEQWRKPASQALGINYAILTGSLTQAQIPYELVPFGQSIASVKYGEKRHGPEYDSNGYLIVPGSRVAPAVISQYSGHLRGLGLAIKGLCAADDIQWQFKIQQVV